MILLSLHNNGTADFDGHIVVFLVSHYVGDGELVGAEVYLNNGSATKVCYLTAVFTNGLVEEVDQSVITFLRELGGDGKLCGCGHAVLVIVDLVYIAGTATIVATYADLAVNGRSFLRDNLTISVNFVLNFVTGELLVRCYVEPAGKAVLQNNHLGATGKLSCCYLGGVSVAATAAAGKKNESRNYCQQNTEKLFHVYKMVKVR